MGSRGLNDVPTLEHLGVAECWRLLESHTFGRICYDAGNRVHVVITTYVARADRIYFRATAFGPVARLVMTRPVTLQVDDTRGEQQAAWSVTATGTAEHVEDAATMASLWTPVRPVSWEIGQESMWIALVPDDICGLRPRA